MKIDSIKLKPEKLGILFNRVNNDPRTYNGDFISSFINSDYGAFVVREDLHKNLLVSHRTAPLISGMVQVKIPPLEKIDRREDDVALEFHIALYLFILVPVLLLLGEAFMFLLLMVKQMTLSDFLICQLIPALIVTTIFFLLYFECKSLKKFIQEKSRPIS